MEGLPLKTRFLNYLENTEDEYIETIAKHSVWGTFTACLKKKDVKALGMLLREFPDIVQVTLSHIAECNDAPTLEVLLKHCAPGMVDAHKDTLLLSAVYMKKSLEFVKVLIGVGANVNAVRKNCHTSLMYASAYSLDIVKLLIESGANVNGFGKYMSTPLVYAAIYATKTGNEEGVKIIRFLVENGAFMETRGEKSLLEHLITQSRLQFSAEVVELLIRLGAPCVWLTPPDWTTIRPEIAELLHRFPVLHLDELRRRLDEELLLLIGEREPPDVAEKAEIHEKYKFEGVPLFRVPYNVLPLAIAHYVESALDSPLLGETKPLLDQVCGELRVKCEQIAKVLHWRPRATQDMMEIAETSVGGLKRERE